MSLKLNERYPGRYNNPTADYPQGSFKNRTTPTAKDGSYLEQDWANDKEGFFQSLLAKAAVEANGVVDKVGSSQAFDALLRLGQNQEGKSFTTGGTATALTLAPAPAILSYAEKQRFNVTFSIDSGLNPTLNVSTKGAKNLKQYGPTGVKVSAVFAAGQNADVVYDGTDFILLDPLPSIVQATETVAGGGKVATQALTNAGTDDATIVTPKKLKAGFSVLLAQNGYISFPSWLGGVTIQWGRKAAPSSGNSDTVTFNTVFPTLCAFGSFNLENTAGAASTSSVVPSVGSMAISISPAAFSAGTNYRWWSIGW